MNKLIKLKLKFAGVIIFTIILIFLFLIYVSILLNSVTTEIESKGLKSIAEDIWYGTNKSK